MAFYQSIPYENIDEEYVKVNKQQLLQILKKNYELEVKLSEMSKLKNENHNLKEQLQNFIPRRRVRRVYKMLGKILRTDVSDEFLQNELNDE